MVVVMVGLWVVCGALFAWADLGSLGKRGTQQLTKFQLAWRAFWDFAGLTLATLLALRFVFGHLDIFKPSHYAGWLSALYAGTAVVIGIVTLAIRTLLRRVITAVPLSRESRSSSASSRVDSAVDSDASSASSLAENPSTAQGDRGIRAGVREANSASFVDSASSASRADLPFAPVSRSETVASATSTADPGSSLKNLNISREKQKPRIVLSVVTIIATAIAGVSFLGTWWFLDFFGHMTPEQFMFNIYSPVGGAARGPMDDVYTRPVLLLVALLALVIWLLFTPYQWRIRVTDEVPTTVSHTSDSHTPTPHAPTSHASVSYTPDSQAPTSYTTQPTQSTPRPASSSVNSAIPATPATPATNANTITISRRTRQNATAVLAFILLAIGLTYGVIGMQIPAIAHQMLAKSTYIDENYVDPRGVQLTFPAKKRNLIHIYFESVESSYLDKAHGGYMNENLMPDLMKLADEGVHFSNTSKPFGGPHQVFGTSWSSAGMTNMNLGVPVKIPTPDTGYGTNSEFLPGAWGYTDILNAQGYNQELLLGCDAHFGGLDALYTTHGVGKVFDVKTARETGKVPPDYMVWWGFEDNKLYEYAKEEITALAGKGKPFAFVMENADTHFPDGYMEPETEHKFGQQYANVIFHSQKQLTDFVRWIQQQPFAPDTSIVITGDHLSMDPNFFKGWSSDYERTTFNAFLNADFPERGFATTNRQYAPYDYLPTILSSLGVRIEGDRLALGTNLASDKQTLIERDGKATVSAETAKYSRFYADHLLHDSK